MTKCKQLSDRRRLFVFILIKYEANFEQNVSCARITINIFGTYLLVFLSFCFIFAPKIETKER
jgi:hypothetical protein